ALVIGDVSGHGLPAALLMSETRAYVRAFMLSRTDIADVLSEVNRALTSDTGNEAFVTLLLARFDPQARTLSYAGAGHPPGYVLDAAGNLKSELPSTGLPLGVDEQSTFSTGPTLQLE